MSKLLLDERPLIVLPSLATLFNSSDEAIIFQQLHYWLQNSNNVRDGYKWVYNSMAEWQKQFPWIKSRTTLIRYFNDLEKRGLVITGNYNKAKFDKTKWYRIDYDALSEIEQRLYRICTTDDQNLVNGVTNNCTTNTIDYTETTTETTSSSSSVDSSNRSTEGSEEEAKRNKILSQIKEIAKSQDFGQVKTLPTVSEWRNVRSLSKRFSVIELKNLALSFKEQMQVGVIEQPYRYLLKMMRDELQNRRV